MRDLHSNIDVTKMLTPQLITAAGDDNSATMDTVGGDSHEVVVSTGASGDTLSGSQYIEHKLEHGDESDGSDAVACTQDDVLTSETIGTGGVFATIDDPAEDEVVDRIGYRGNKRYVRVKTTFTGTHTNGTIVGVNGVQGNLNASPAATA